GPSKMISWSFQMENDHLLLQRSVVEIIVYRNGLRLGRYFAVAYTGPSGGYDDEQRYTALSPEALAVIASSTALVWRKDRHPQLIPCGF
ncbi:unnamed protein product, partial [Coccothraustes coccothraustes]